METDSAACKAQISVIRAEIKQNGEAFVGCNELEILCGSDIPVRYQFEAIAKIAIEEEWSFTFLPDGQVRFAAFADDERRSLRITV